jgi:hypothetical protein
MMLVFELQRWVYFKIRLHPGARGTIFGDGELRGGKFRGRGKKSRGRGRGPRNFGDFYIFMLVKSESDLKLIINSGSEQG